MSLHQTSLLALKFEAGNWQLAEVHAYEIESIKVTRGEEASGGTVGVGYGYWLTC